MINGYYIEKVVARYNGIKKRREGQFHKMLFVQRGVQSDRAFDLDSPKWQDRVNNNNSSFTERVDNQRNNHNVIEID